MIAKALLAIFLVAAAAPAVAEGTTCDRGCLESTVDRFLDALVKHDAKLAPLACSSATCRRDRWHSSARCAKRTRPTAPWTWELAEMFKLEQGKIRRIEAILDRAPYGMGLAGAVRRTACQIVRAT
jgi:hypothetical protein